MNAGCLLTLYDRVADAPDAIPRLRRFVLDLAVRGKLVEQNQADEPASELLRRIAVETARLVKNKEIRKPKVLPAYDPESQPFGVPSQWTWARLNELSPRSLTDGDWIETKDQSPDGGIRLVQLADVGVGEFIDKSNRFVTHETAERLKCTRLVVGDVLIARLPNPIGRACIFPDIGQPAITAVDVAILRTDKNIAAEYVAAAMNAPSTRDQIEAYGKGATRFRVSTGHLRTVLIPVPPLAEQRRIVAKIDELMALCGRLEAAQTAREATRDRLTAASLARLTATGADANTFRTHARFAIDALPALTARPDQINALRQTILNLAVRGKLVEQDPTDEPVSALDRSIPKDVRPFAIPTTWRWAQLSLLGKIQGGGTPSKVRDDFWNGNIPWVSPKDMKADYIETAQLSITEAAISGSAVNVIEPQSVLFVVRGMILAHSFPVAVSRVPLTINQDMKAIVLNEPKMAEYVLRALKGLKPEMLARVQRSSHGTCRIERSDYADFLLPVPPLAEQHRIVSKVDALMALCNRLEASLREGGTTRRRLLAALLHEILHHEALASARRSAGGCGMSLAIADQFSQCLPALLGTGDA